MKWNELKTANELKLLIEKSHRVPVLIFKHSTRCSISDMALSRLERDWGFTEQELEPWFLDLIAYRELSNRVALETNIRHESPQLILLKDGIPIYHASHYAIRVADIPV